MNNKLLGSILGVMALCVVTPVFGDDSLEQRVDALENNANSPSLTGQLQLDTGQWFDDNDSAALDNGIDFRRVRLGTKGEVGDGWGYKIELDGSSSVTVQDAYVGKRITIGDFELKAVAGQHKAGTSIDENTSSQNLTFQERAIASNISASNFGARRIGSSVVLTLPYTYIHTGLFGKTLSGSTQQLSWNTRGMITGLENRIGVGGSMATLLDRDDSATHTLQYSNTPETRIDGAALIDTGTITADSANHYTISGFGTIGSIHAQGEYFIEDITVNSTTDRSFNGYYGQLGYMVTGEHREWNAETATWKRITPVNDWGAIELAYRYSYQDLNDVTITGGIETNHTAAVNYYQGKNVKIGVNVIRGTFDAANTTNDFIFAGLRTQVSF